MPITIDEFEVVVAGSGVAGLSAAVAALEEGAAVAIIERASREESGGNTRYTEAFLRMKSEEEVSDDFIERLIEHAGTHFDPSIMAHTVEPYERWPSIVKSLGFADPELVSAFALECGPTIAWLRSHGLRFSPTETPFITSATPRMAPVGGGLAIVEQLTAEVERLGGCFFYEHTAETLLSDDEGRISGLAVKDQNGGPVTFDATQVVLATGGFEGNQEMQAAYLGTKSPRLRPIARGGYYNKGEGIRMALAMGAAPCGDFSQYHAEPIDPRSGAAEPAIFIFPYGVLVNREGYRFVDEGGDTVDATYEGITRIIANQGDGLAWVILDESVKDVPRWRSAIRSDQPPITASSLEGLADLLGIEAESLTTSILTYNAGCAAGNFDPLVLDGLATVGVEPPKSNWARPLDHPPFAAYPITAANVFTFGGVKVSSRAEVIDSDGRVISGLYAAGEVAGLYYGRYTGSTSVLRGAVLGRAAGATAARAIAI